MVPSASVTTTSVDSSDSIKTTCANVSLLKFCSNIVRCEFPLACKLANSSSTLELVNEACKKTS